MASNVRLRLGEPRTQRPSGRAVLQAVCTKSQSLINQIADSGVPWAVDEIQLNVVGGQGDYLLPVDSYFGKPLQVLTYYPANQSIPQRYVEFVMLNDLNYDWNLPVNVASYMFTDGSPNTAMRIAFYRQGGEDNMWCRVLPMPQLPATYTILFSVGNWADSAGLDESPVLAQFHPLIEVQAATSLLAQSEWNDSEPDNRIRRKEFAQGFQYDESALQDDWQRYVRNITSDHLSTRDADFGEGGVSWGGWY